MKAHYDAEAAAMYLRLKKGHSNRTFCSTDETVTVDVDERGYLVGIELLDPHGFIKAAMRALPGETA